MARTSSSDFLFAKSRVFYFFFKKRLTQEFSGRKCNFDPNVDVYLFILFPFSLLDRILGTYLDRRSVISMLGC